MAYNKQDIDCIWIGGEKFKGIGYQGLLTVNTKTYVEEPTRANDGSIPNINEHDTFFVPRAKVNFKLMSIEDYERLCRVVSASNEFVVKYFDKQTGEFVEHNMYCEPQEMLKLYNIGINVIGVLDFEISFIGTLNNLSQYNVKYYLNASPNDSSILSDTNYVWGNSMVVMTSNELEEICQQQSYTIPSGAFNGWNTKRDGSGINYYPNKNEVIFDNLELYAQWQDLLFTGLDKDGNITTDDDDIVSYMVGDGTNTNGNGLLNSQLTIVDIPNTYKGKPVTIIGQYAFAETNITSITLPKNIKTLSKKSFSNCLVLQTINYNCVDLNPIAYNDYVWEKAGNNRSGITVNIGNNVISLPEYAFGTINGQYKSNITSIVFIENSNCVSIGNYAFALLNLTTLTLPNSVTIIGKYAFMDTGITTLTLGENISYFENAETFYWMNNLVSVTVYAVVPPKFKYSNPAPFKDSSNLANIYVPASSVDAYKYNSIYNVWSRYRDIISAIQ